MKFIFATSLLAASALAVPHSKSRRADTYISITEFSATGASVQPGGYMTFRVTDPNYPEDTPTYCNLIWDYGTTPDANARCSNEEYYIKFPQGPVDLNLFTLELQRVNGSIPEDGHVLLSSNANGGAPGTQWICEDNPEPEVEIRCAYNGTLLMEV